MPVKPQDVYGVELKKRRAEASKVLPEILKHVDEILTDLAGKSQPGTKITLSTSQMWLTHYRHEPWYWELVELVAESYRNVGWKVFVFTMQLVFEAEEGAW